MAGGVLTEEYFQYNLDYNEHHYVIKISAAEDWGNGNLLQDLERTSLDGLLYNNEWPFESETTITIELIKQLMRFRDFPVKFEEKINYFLRKCILRKADEHIPIPYDVTSKLDLYAGDEDEYKRLFDELVSSDLVVLPDKLSVLNKNRNRKLKLTRKGIDKGKELQKEWEEKQPKRFEGGGTQPRVVIYADENDKFYAKQLNDLFLQYGLSVSSYDNLKNEHGLSVIKNSKSTIGSTDTDYLVFVKSSSSDTNNTFGSILNRAVSAHEDLNEKHYRYLFIAFVDGSKLEDQPVLIEYNSDALDVRIKNNRLRLIKNIQEDWQKRKQNIQGKSRIIVDNSSPQFNFPKMELKEGEEYWLKQLYKNFIKGEEENYINFISKHWDFLPKGFDPLKINSLLAESGARITLYGIWTIEPNSKYIIGVKDSISAIKSILNENGNSDQITGAQLQAKLNYPIVDIVRFVTLLNRFGGFMHSSNPSKDGKDLKIRIESSEHLNAYENFSSLEAEFMRKYSDLFPNDNPAPENEELTEKKTTIGFEVISSRKSKLVYPDKKEINPVMGVAELSEDLAEIIKDLPSEKGQMIGIFGKWGRGKTFLLSELWNNLKEGKETKYIKLEYHAWKYQETPASWAYLYELFANQYLGKKGVCYALKLLKLNIKRVGIFSKLKLAFLAFASAALALYIPQILKKYDTNNFLSYIGCYSILGVSVISLLKLFSKDLKLQATDLIKKYSIRHSFKETLGIQADVQEELIKLLKVWIPKKKIGKKKILLIVEDIDRCSEDKIIQNVDALRVLLEDDEICQRVVIVTAIDERILKNAIKLKYDSILPNASKPKSNSQDYLDINELVSEYLDKLFISAVKLGGLSFDQRNEYLSELLKKEMDGLNVKDLISRTAHENLQSIQTPINETVQASTAENSSLEENRVDNSEQVNRQDKEVNEATTENKSETDKVNTENKPNENTSNNIFEKLTETEILLLAQVVEKWESLTPRRIRIFYYRYLLCKNLLINKYSRLNAKCLWQDKKGIKIMMFLLLNYTKKHNPNLISTEKDKYLTDKEQEITIEVNNESYHLNKVDYLHLLEVLELVVAY